MIILYEIGFFGQLWPLNNIFMQQTISGEVMNLLNTFVVSCIQYTSNVKTSIVIRNPQVTKTLSSWVGTSEAIRLLSYSSSNSNQNSLNEWLAGLIDGAGYFLLSKKGYASLEITMNIRDEHCLNILKNKYGGYIKLRSNANALIYRLHHKAGLLSLINDVNGLIRNPDRIIQLNKICVHYGLRFIFPSKLTCDNGWLAGFLDSDGIITINKTKIQLSISVTQKSNQIFEPLIELYGGSIYIDRGNYESFKWYITKRETILNIIQYFKQYPSRSGKKSRLHLIPKYYELKDLKAHQAKENSLLGKAWVNFLSKWNKGVAAAHRYYSKSSVGIINKVKSD